MSAFIIILGICLVTILCVCALWYYAQTPSDPVGKLSFKQFKLFYYLAPTKWYLYSGFPAYRLDSAIYSKALYFSFIDTIRYKRWKRKLDEEEKSENNNEKFQKILESIQNDLEKYKEKHFLNVESKEQATKSILEATRFYDYL